MCPCQHKQIPYINMYTCTKLHPIPISLTLPTKPTTIREDNTTTRAFSTHPNLRKACAHFSYPNQASTTKYSPVPRNLWVTHKVVAVVLPYSSNHYIKLSMSIPSITSAARIVPVYPHNNIFNSIPQGIGLLMMSWIITSRSTPRSPQSLFL